jgi:PAS domain S-box-containing protein
VGVATRQRLNTPHSAGRLLRRPIVAASMVFVAGLLITSLAAVRWSRSDSSSAEMRVHFMEVRTSDQILARMGIYEQLLQGARAMATAVGPQNISRQLFKRYSEGQDLARRFPAVRGLGLVRRQIRADQAGSADDRPVGYIAQLVEPEGANSDLVGVDLGFDANSREAAERSLRSGTTTLSAPMTWSPLGLRPPDALLLWLPIYTETAALNGQTRSDVSQVFGWIYASINIEIEFAALNVDAEGYSLTLRDLAANADTFYSSPDIKPSPDAEMRRSFPIRLYGRTWQADIQAQPMLIAGLGGSHVRVTAAAGTALSAILALWMFALRRDRQKIWSALDRRGAHVPLPIYDAVDNLLVTREGVERRVNERSVTVESARRDLRTILDALPTMVAYWDRNLINCFANRASESWFEAPPGALFGKHMRQVLGENLFQRDSAHIEAALRGEARIFEQSEVKSDGNNYRHTITHYVPDVDHSDVRGFYVLVYDVSELTESRLQLAGARRESEEMLRTLDMHSKVSITDDKGYITHVNENFCRILGYSSDEVLGRPHSVVNSGVHPREFWTQMWDTISSGRPWRGEICNRAKDGSLHWVDCIIAPFLGKDGRVQKYVSIGTNISTSKATEQRLRYNEDFLERIGTVAGLGGWEFDVRTRAITWSPQTYRILEVDSAYEPHVDTDIEFYAKEARAIFYKSFAECIERGTAWDHEIPAVTARGRSIWVRTVGTPEMRNGKVERVIGALQDVTARKKAECQLQESAERFAIAADSAGIGVWELDTASDALLWDAWMYRIYGIEKTREIENYGLWLGALHPDDRERCEAEVLASSRGPGEFDSEFRIVRPNGEMRYIKAASRAVRAADGTSLRITGVNFDVTNARNSETVARRETASLLRTVLDAASEVSIIATDENLMIRVFSAGAERMLGFDSSEVVGKEILSRIHDPRDLETLGRQLSMRLGRRIVAHQTIVEPTMLRRSHERVYVRKDGVHITVSLFVTAIRSDDDEIRGYVCVGHDITQHNIDQRALHDAIVKAENANAAKSQFLANMSHEIRTPMNAVIGLSYLLRHTSLSVEQASFLGKIQVASNSLLSIITNILDLSKIEANELLVESVVFSLSDLLRDVAAVITVHSDAKAIQFSMHAPNDLPEALIGDPTRLRQILINILSNAVRFTDVGSVQFTISVRSREAGKATLCFEVTDTGIGIATEQQETLFAPFAQADVSITRRYGGTGLGLSIVKQLTKLLGGTVMLDSVVGIGSTFTVMLPFVSAALDDLAAAREPAVAHAQGALFGIRALIVDDSDINREVAKRILELDGVQVSLASDGQQALDRLRTAPDAFDVIFMDVQMPVMDGYDATRRIRRELGLIDLPIIAVTASALSSERQRAAEAGMTDFICKPFDGQSLARSVLRHIRPVNTRQAAPHPAAASAPSSPDVPWPEIAGIDTLDACARWCGDAALFLKMLRRLFVEFGQVAVPAEFADAAALTPYIRRMHKLRGGACMLGAKAVYALAGQIEEACIRGDEQSAVELGIALTAEMQRLFENATPAMEAAQTAAPDPAPADLQACEARVGELGTLLRQQSLVAVKCFDSLSPYLRRTMGEDSYGRMRSYIDNLQFDAASDELLDTARR